MDFLEITFLVIFIVSILWMHLWVIIRKHAKSILSRICLLDGLALLLVMLGLFYPKTYNAFMGEDGIAEWITFYAFILSSCIIAAHLWSSRKNGFTFFSSNFLIPMAVAVFCLIVAGEEVSWGQRLFSFRPPDLFLEQNYQQELNIHNLFKGDGFWGIQIESKHLVMLIAFFYGILFPLITRFITPLKSLNTFAPQFYLMPYFILVIAMEEIYPISFTGEASEMFLGIIFLLSIYHTYPVEKVKNHTWYRLSTLMILIFVMSIITAPLLNFFVYGSDEKAEAVIREEMEQLRKDFLHAEADNRKIIARKKVHKRIYTAIAQNYFHLPKESMFLGSKQTPANTSHGRVRNDRKGYFLDPWNNPYWIYYSRNENTVILYSFGANRRRDSNFRRDLGLKADDVGVVFNVND